MKNDFLITVIVPVYNVEQYLEKCIKSLITQTYNNLEIILINDGSSDLSGQICDEYKLKDSRIRVIHKQNEGQGVARNIGLELANGQYISFIDSDDWIDEEMFRDMMNTMIQNECDMVLCGIKTYTGIKTYLNHMVYDTIILNNFQLMKTYVSTSLIHRGPCNKLYSIKLFEHIKFPSIRAREDAYIMHEILGECNKAAIIPQSYYNQYVRLTSTEKSRFNSNKLSLIDCSLKLRNYIKENYVELYHYVEFDHLNAIIIILEDILISFSYIQYKELYIKLIDELNKYVRECEKDSTNKTEIILKSKKIIRNNFIFRIKTRYKGCIILFKKIIKIIFINLNKSN